jgi:ankyrin repeat protein
MTPLSRQVTSNLRNKSSSENIINKTNAYGHTLLYCACRGGFLNLVKALLDLGANIDLKSRVGIEKFESNLEVASRYMH